MKPIFFKSPSHFRKWLEKNHSNTRELWVGFYKKGSGKPSLTWPESVDQALCFGWIDGIRKSIDEHSYTIRFTPRRVGSTWSAINIKRAQELGDEGLMWPAGLQAFQMRKENKSGLYSYEQRASVKLSEPYTRKFRRNKAAWDLFQARPPWYQRTTTWWVMSAKMEETRLRRLDKIIEDCARGRPIGQMTRTKASK